MIRWTNYLVYEIWVVEVVVVDWEVRYRETVVLPLH
jgi:hypothetical protein